jgi:dihydrofolate reductase
MPNDILDAMRKIVLAAGISMDGYIARKDGTFDWLTPDPDHDRDFTAFFSTIDAVIMGRKTWVEFKKGPSLNMPTYVYSRSEPPGARDGVEFGSASADEVREMKSRPGKNIWLAGGGEMAREFLKQDLIDQIDIAIIPVLLGDGIPLFPPGFPQRNFKVASQRTTKTGRIAITYSR